MIEVKVARLGIEINSKMPVIILKEIGGEKAVLIRIGFFELQAIALALRKVRPPRPLTHDLLKLLIEGLEGEVDRVVITNFINNAFYARIFVRRNGENIKIDSRPGDAIALALRVKAPIFINETVLNKVALGTKPISDKEIEDFEKRLKDLKPQDFTG
jgi:bifunctional DNase/RNase